MSHEAMQMSGPQPPFPLVTRAHALNTLCSFHEGLQDQWRYRVEDLTYPYRLRAIEQVANLIEVLSKGVLDFKAPQVMGFVSQLVAMINQWIGSSGEVDYQQPDKGLQDILDVIPPHDAVFAIEKRPPRVFRQHSAYFIAGVTIDVDAVMADPMFWWQKCPIPLLSATGDILDQFFNDVTECELQLRLGVTNTMKDDPSGTGREG